jgi:hypothetical protein
MFISSWFPWRHAVQDKGRTRPSHAPALRRRGMATHYSVFRKKAGKCLPRRDPQCPGVTAPSVFSKTGVTTGGKNRPRKGVGANAPGEPTARARPMDKGRQ